MRPHEVKRQLVAAVNGGWILHCVGQGAVGERVAGFEAINPGFDSAPIQLTRENAKVFAPPKSRQPVTRAIQTDRERTALIARLYRRGLLR
jgi:hypothetical protein